VSPVRVRFSSGIEMPVAFDVADHGVGYFELFICAECGHSAWYANGLDAVIERGCDVRASSGDVGRCRGCGDASLLCVAMKDAVSSSKPPPRAAIVDVGEWGRASPPQGLLTTRICRICGLADWYASDPANLQHPLHTLGVTEELCEVCAGGRRTRIRARERSTLEVDTLDTPVAVRISAWGWKRLGRFEIQICTSCGHTRWVAIGLEQLDEDSNASLSVIEPTQHEPRSPYR